MEKQKHKGTGKPKKVRHRDVLVGNKEVADLLNVSPNTVMNWTKGGKISGVVIGSVYRYHIPTIAKEHGIPDASVEAFFAAVG